MHIYHQVNVEEIVIEDIADFQQQQWWHVIADFRDDEK